jgi:hypothetical protein
MLPSYRQICATMFAAIWHDNWDFHLDCPDFDCASLRVGVDPKEADLRVAFGELDLKLMVDRDKLILDQPQCPADLYEYPFRDCAVVLMTNGVHNEPLAAVIWPALARYAVEHAERVDTEHKALGVTTIGGLFIRVEQLLLEAS